MSKRFLVLWDIDGTLVSSSGAGLRALKRGLESVFGVRSGLEGLEWAGKTDLLIMRDILKSCGIKDSAEAVGKFAEAYLGALEEEVKGEDVVVLPGVLEIIKMVERKPGWAQGLLTGNLRRGAKVKLGRVDLWKHFRFGAFADDAEQRNAIAPFAVRRASQVCSYRWAGPEVVVVGDTPRDVECARVVGAWAAGVATGVHGRKELEECGADLVFDDLSDVDGFFAKMEQFGGGVADRFHAGGHGYHGRGSHGHHRRHGHGHRHKFGYMDRREGLKWDEGGKEKLPSASDDESGGKAQRPSLNKGEDGLDAAERLRRMRH